MNLLIVDDSKMILKMAQDILLGNKVDANILLCESGEEALELIKGKSIDVVLLDIVMPNYTGMEVLRDLSEGGYLNRTRVLMFSSLSDKFALKECFELGAFDYILKPLEPIEFISRVNNALTDQKLRRQLSDSLEDSIRQNIVLENLNQKLRETQTELIHKEQMAGIGRLAAGIAHEINNPLGFITSNIETLKEYMMELIKVEEIFEHIVVNFFNELPDHIKRKIKDDVDIKEIKFIKEDEALLFEDTMDGLGRVKRIVSGLKNFSNIDKNDELHSYNISESIENIMHITLSESRDIGQVDVDLKDIPDIFAYGSELNQALLNIIRNGISAISDKGNKSEGVLKIKTDYDDDYIYCTILDNGIGIPEEMYNDIFKPFFTTRPVGQGTGLGLSIAYDVIVNKHKGAIDLESIVGEGTNVTIKLPRFLKGNDK